MYHFGKKYLNQNLNQNLKYNLNQNQFLSQNQFVRDGYIKVFFKEDCGIKTDNALNITWYRSDANVGVENDYAINKYGDWKRTTFSGQSQSNVFPTIASHTNPSRDDIYNALTDGKWKIMISKSNNPPPGQPAEPDDLGVPNMFDTLIDLESIPNDGSIIPGSVTAAGAPATDIYLRFDKKNFILPNWRRRDVSFWKKIFEPEPEPEPEIQPQPEPVPEPEPVC
jgi:hypothetical protein